MIFLPKFYYIPDSDSLLHHGTKGQKWGKRRFQNKDGSLTPEGREHYGYGHKNPSSDIERDYPHLNYTRDKINKGHGIGTLSQKAQNKETEQSIDISERIRKKSGDVNDGFSQPGSHFEKAYAQYTKSNGYDINDLKRTQKYYAQQQYLKNNPKLNKEVTDARTNYYYGKKRNPTLVKAVNAIAKSVNAPMIDIRKSKSPSEPWNTEHYLNSKKSKYAKEYVKAGEDAVNSFEKQFKNAKVKKLSKKQWDKELTKAVLKDLGYKPTDVNIRDIMEGVVYP